MSYQYCQEARVRVSKLGQAVITAFFEEVPKRLRQQVYDRLLKIQGFRPGTTAEFSEKQKRLITHLVHPNASQTGVADWTSFANLWVFWGIEHFGASFPKGAESALEADAGVNFLTELANNCPNAAREDVERLFIFSGFADHPEVASKLNRFRTSKDLEHERLMDGLPIRVKRLEDRLTVTESGTADVAKRTIELKATIDSFAKKTDELSIRTVGNTEELVELRVAWENSERRYSEIDSVVKELALDLDIISKEVSNGAIEAKSFKDTLSALTNTGDDLNRVAADIEKIKSAVSDLLSRDEEYSEHSALIKGLSDRVAALERILAGGVSREIKPQRVRLFESRHEGPMFDIDSVESALEIITSNFQAVGFMRESSAILARNVVAGLVAGQLIQFSGSLADLATDALAAAVSGHLYHEWRVPVGLVSDEAASDCVETVVGSSGCLIIKGANLSAFDVYGTALRDIVARRQYIEPVYGWLALVASWSQGPASIPDGGTLAELGPVFNTDEVQVRGLLSEKKPALKFGRLIKDSWEKIYIPSSKVSTQIKELGDILKEAGFEGGNLWRRVANRAFVILRSLPDGTQEKDLGAILLNWAIPWSTASAGPATEIVRIAERDFAINRVEEA